MTGVQTCALPISRLAPDERRSQLLDLGVRLLATRSLDQLSIDLLAEEAGISRGLLYHYFGNKHAFHEAVVRRAADDLIAQTAPPAGDARVVSLRMNKVRSSARRAAVSLCWPVQDVVVRCGPPPSFVVRAARRSLSQPRRILSVLLPLLRLRRPRRGPSRGHSKPSGGS